MPDHALVADHLGKTYWLYQRPVDRLREAVFGPRVGLHTEFAALHDVSFELERGKTLGILGRNGSGKSTLLQMLAGVTRPTMGTFVAKGRIGALLELGAGFSPEFTGRENVMLNGAIQGFTERQMRDRLPRIADFAEIGDFIDRPVKTYSSGMYVRLAFATMINLDPDILIVDEALAVGDILFQHRCMRRFHELKSQGVTVVLVSHNPEVIKEICDEGLLLDSGRVIGRGRPDEVANQYLALMFGNRAPRPTSASLNEVSFPDVLIETDPAGSRTVRSIPRQDGRFGNGAAEIIGIESLDEHAEPKRVWLHGETILIRVSVRFNDHLPQPIVGVSVRDNLGVDVTRTNTDLEAIDLPAVSPGDVLTVDFAMQLPLLSPGSLAFSPAVAEGSLHGAYVICDWVENALVVALESEYEVHGKLRFPTKVEAYYTPVSAADLPSPVFRVRR